MAQQVWFLRHGDAEAHGTGEDFDRRLTGRGEGQSRDAGAAMARLGIGFDAVFTSPRVRALETARLAAAAAGAEEPIVHESLSGGFDAADARTLVAGFGPDARILVVGHEPDFSEAIHDLTGATVDMKKGGVAGVRFVPAGLHELIVLLRPRETAAVARDAGGG